MRLHLALSSLTCALLTAACWCDEQQGGADCQESIKTILAIQDKRTAHMEEMNEVIRLYERKEISREAMLERSHRWKEEEGALGIEVAKLYKKAHKMHCLTPGTLPGQKR